MPRHRKRDPRDDGGLAGLEKRLKLFRQWIAAQKEVEELRKILDEDRRRIRRRREVARVSNRIRALYGDSQS